MFVDSETYFGGYVDFNQIVQSGYVSTSKCCPTLLQVEAAGKVHVFSVDLTILIV